MSHPANWGPYKRDLLDQVVRLADVVEPVIFTTEPEAAAAFYAQQQRIDPGAVVAVYDLGGGTFDATVLRKAHGPRFEILGQSEGIERLGGIDFDEAVFNHVSQALQGKLSELDEDDPTSIAAVARLREECVQAKEALSADTDVSIPVLLPNLATEIRLTRAELETMVRPALYSTIEALRRALRSAGVSPEQLHSVLLVGGSSRMPLVAQLVGAELGRPVAVDAHPKHAVALGAAWLASGAQAAAPGVRQPAGVRQRAGVRQGAGARQDVGARQPVAARHNGGVPQVGERGGRPLGAPPPGRPQPADNRRPEWPGSEPRERGRDPHADSPEPTELVSSLASGGAPPPGVRPPIAEGVGVLEGRAKVAGEHWSSWPVWSGSRWPQRRWYGQ